MEAPRGLDVILQRLLTGSPEAVMAPPPGPVHTVYGGAQLFRADLVARVGAQARTQLETYGGGPVDFVRACREGVPGALAEEVHRAVVERLTTRPVDDYRVDFEDGFGPRSDEEEDREALRVAAEVLRGMKEDTLPRGLGIRVRALERPTAARALRTLELVVGTIARGAGALPRGFVVALPKVRQETEVTALADALTVLEGSHGLAPGSLALELMVETPEALVSHGRLRPRALVDAARGRCVAVHLGAYDLTARLGVGARDQRLGHPYCALARQVLALELHGTGVAVSDGATTRLPVPPHRGAALDEAQREANALAVRAAWRAHADNVSEALGVGIDRGWDLHPGQLPARFAALFLHHREGFRDTCARLRAFLARGAVASLHQGLMDDAATGQAMLNAVLRAVDCGAVAEAEAAEGVGCSLGALRGRSFGDLVRGAGA